MYISNLKSSWLLVLRFARVKKKNGIYKTNHKQVDAAGIKREDKAGGAR